MTMIGILQILLSKPSLLNCLDSIQRQEHSGKCLHADVESGYGTLKAAVSERENKSKAEWGAFLACIAT